MIEMMYPRNSLHSIFLLGVIVKMLASQDMVMPKFKTIHVGSNYSVRCYTNTRWAETKSNSEDIKFLHSDIYKSISNKKDQNYKWKNGTFPIRIKFTSSSQLNHFTLQVYAPIKKQTQLSSKTNKNIVFLTPKEECFYVRSFKKQDFPKVFSATVVHQLNHLRHHILSDPFPNRTEIVKILQRAKDNFYLNLYKGFDNKVKPPCHEVMIKYS